MHPRVLAASVALVALVACSKKPDTTPAADTTAMVAPTQPLKVNDIHVGRSIGADNRVASDADTFKPADTIYASVNTDGAAPNATLSAKWTYQDGQVVDTTSRSIAPTGPATTEFHVSKPSGWPKGSYKVEIMLNGASAGTKDFKVQ